MCSEIYKYSKTYTKAFQLGIGFDGNGCGMTVPYTFTPSDILFSTSVRHEFSRSVPSSTEAVAWPFYCLAPPHNSTRLFECLLHFDSTLKSFLTTVCVAFAISFSDMETDGIHSLFFQRLYRFRQGSVWPVKSHSNASSFRYCLELKNIPCIALIAVGRTATPHACLSFGIKLNIKQSLSIICHFLLYFRRSHSALQRIRTPFR